MNASRFSSNVFFNVNIPRNKTRVRRIAIHVSSCKLSGPRPNVPCSLLSKILYVINIIFSLLATVSATCGSSDFSCDNGNCIDAVLKCDQENDCGDNSDEKNCPERKCNFVN